MLPEKQLDAVLDQIMAGWDVPGLAVGLVQDGQVIYTRLLGVQSLADGAPLSPESVFCVASVSKCFTAAAVMQLAERGRIDLDAPLAACLPDFRLDDERYAQATIRQVLSHTSGLPDFDEIEYDQMVAEPEMDEQAAERWLRSLGGRQMVADPGERFSYSNIAYNLLGVLIARAAGTSFESYLRENVLLPAGMTESTFLLADIPSERLVIPHLRSPEMKPAPRYPYHRADAPSSFLHATLRDMCSWSITSLECGRGPRRAVLSPAGYDAMWSPAADWGFNRPSMYEDMGLGWTLGHYRGARTVSHGGMGFGWTDFLLLLPEHNSAAVVLCNEESFARTRTVHAAADALLGLEPQAGPVSWMVPVSRALAQGGTRAARAWYADFRACGQAGYQVDPNDLLNLSIQLVSARRADLALQVLDMNAEVHPRHTESHVQQARIYRQLGDRESFEACLARALAIDPDDPAALSLLNQNR